MTGRLRSLASASRRLLSRGPAHRERLASVDTTVVVTGVRGKSSAVELLHDVLHARGQDVLGKLTGDRPTVLENGQRHEVERSGRVTLHENERVLREYGPSETLVLENQAISDYTNWVFNRYVAAPDVVLLTNVRQDHRDTLGRNRTAIARSLARSIPSGTTVISGEQDERYRDVIDAELDRRDASAVHVDVPERHRQIPGAEVVYAVDAVLERVADRPMAEHLLERCLDGMRVSWTELPEGRVYDAASANDVESTEAIRRSLERRDAPIVQPLCYLRPDRRARTDAFRTYLESLYDRGKISHAHVVGPNTATFARGVEFPVVEHEPSADAASVLDELLGVDQPTMLMGNTVADFVRDLQDEIEARAERVEQRAAETARGAADARSDDAAATAPAGDAGGSGDGSGNGDASERSTSPTERALRGSGD